jgi:hypothetical protein
MDWKDNLIALFLYINEKYQQELWIYCQRMSNNRTQLRLSDEEVIAIYLFGVIRGHSKVKEIYHYTKDHLIDWFPNLPSYVAFVIRLNRLESVFPVLIENILADFSSNDLLQDIRLIDSLPIIMAHEKRSNKAKVANEFANKGYCSSKGMYYYGVKVHILGLKRTNTLPLPNYIGVTPASDHDLSTFRQIAPLLHGGKLFADKAYIDELERESLLKEQDVEKWTPAKKRKGQKRLDLFEQLLSTSVSRVRQPIESLFNWIEEKTIIQVASKVRSYNGLMVHVFGKLAAAMFLMVFNS